MTRNSDTRETMHPGAATSTGLYGERHKPGATKKTASAPAAAHTVPDLKTLTREIDECKRLLRNAQYQIAVLVERNTGLKKELTELAQREVQARHLAHHDGLTGLPNRSLLRDRFHQTMSQADRHHKPLALLMVDLDDFKLVNDKLGHANGDALLQAVAQRLTNGIRGADIACRYGGDEFVIMLSEIDTPNIATTLAQEICWRLSEPYIIDGHSVHMAVSVGVAVYPDNGHSFDDLMKQADISMYRTKGTRHRTSITKQSKEETDEAEVRNPPTSENADRMHERDRLIHDASVPTAGATTEART
jgi:diguanylate cyclase (GGDEF)-like protein